MKKLTIKEVVEATKGKLLTGNKDDVVGNVSRDSREVTIDTLFFFLIGESQDGHKFSDEVIAKGVRSLVISSMECWKSLEKSPLIKDLNVIFVEDTAKALQDMAKYYLRLIAPKVIGITGSVGKTSTKDMAFAICQSKYKTGGTKGNYNNEIGMPLTILSLEEDCQVAVLEMGMGNRGEIEVLAQIAEPNIGIITNVGTSHIEKLGSIREIYNEKMDIASQFKSEDVLIYPPDGEYLIEKEENYNKVYVKSNAGEPSDLIIKNIVDKGEEGIEFLAEYMGESELFFVPLMGKHNGINCGLAIAAGLKIGISLKEAKEAIKTVEITKGRLTLKEVSGYKVIDDAYNASPTSMMAAIDILSDLKEEGNKILFLGDILEMGEFAPKYHYKVGEYCKGKNIDTLITVGVNAKEIYKGAISEDKTIAETPARVIHYNNNSEVIADLENIIKKGDTLLFKGSRGVRLEEIINSIKGE